MKYHVSFNLNLIKNPYKGTYIAFEGIDGSGKSTQAARLVDYLKIKNKQVVFTKEPTTDGTITKLIRNTLQSKIHMNPVALQYLFTANRIVNKNNLIIPSLKSGKIVVSDRSFWSSVPYGLSDEKNPNMELAAQGILAMYDQFILPDITFFLDVSVNTALKRLSGRHKIEEIYEKKDKLRKISDGYKWLTDTFRKEITVINGEKSVDEVTQEIVRYNIGV